MSNNIDLTDGEQYTFGKIAGQAVILSGTDNAQATLKIRNRVEINAVSSTTTGLILDQNINSNVTPMIKLHNNNPGSSADVAIEFQSEYDSGKQWRMGIDANSKEFKIIDTTFFTDTTYTFKLDTDGDAYIETDLHVGDDVFVGDNLTVADSLSAGDGGFVVNGSNGNLVLGENNGTDSRITVFEGDSTRRNRCEIGADATSAFINGTFGTGGSTDVRILNNDSVCADFEASEAYFHTIDSSAGNADMKYDTSDGEMTYSTSTRNIKKNIVEISGSDDILKVKSVSYDYKDGSGKDIGFIAEDVAAVNPEFAKYGPDFVYDDNGRKVHKIGKWEEDANGKLVPKQGAFPKGTGPKDRYEKHSDNQVPIDINVRALLSHAIQKIQDLEARLKSLENA